MAHLIAPGTGKFVPFAVSSGGLLAPRALSYLKSLARVRSGPHVQADGTDDAGSAEASQSYLRHGVQLLSTVLQSSNACRIHAAAAEFCELLETDPWPGDVDTPRELRRFNPGLGVRDLFLYDPRVFSLADIDVVGLQPVASLAADLG